MIFKTLYIIFFATILVSLAFDPKTTQAFDWPDGAALAQRIQAIKLDIYYSKMLMAAKTRANKQITAASYLAVDLSTGAVLLEKNQNKAYSIASVTKLMNAVVTLENIDTRETITLTKAMLAPEGKSPAIFLGLNISGKKLLQASLIQSTNDAAESLARSLGKDKFLGLMNQKAKDLKMASTAYYDVHGLNPKNRSTAADMAKLLSYIHTAHPEILDITKDNNFWLPNQNGELLKFQNMNNFYSLPEFIGGKTGYTPEARQTFAAIFDIDKKSVAIVVLRAADFQADTFKIIDKIKATN
ncbi:MAG: serine hydrolase [Candidatus Paceibacterota bacterium]